MIGNASNKIKVLIVDDSALVRKFLATYLKKYDNLEVVDTARDPFDARDKIVKYKPHVLTMDIEMPKMDGVSFLEKLMTFYPIPTIMVSSLTREGSNATLRALEAGAVDFILKPLASEPKTQEIFIKELYSKIMTAAYVNVKNLKSRKFSIKIKGNTKLKPETQQVHNNKIIAIGSSLGGTEALKSVIVALPKNLPGIVIVQHMPEVFTKYFAERLNSMSEIDVYEANDGMPVSPGTAILAPGNHHMEVIKGSTNYSVHVMQGERVKRHRPSVEVLFNSVAKCGKSNAVGVIMTGMGNDGATGLLNMKNAGASTIAQDEESCVVFGMPKEAIKIGAADKVVSLSEIPQTIISQINK